MFTSSIETVYGRDSLSFFDVQSGPLLASSRRLGVSLNLFLVIGLFCLFVSLDSCYLVNFYGSKKGFFNTFFSKVQRKEKLVGLTVLLSDAYLRQNFFSISRLLFFLLAFPGTLLIDVLHNNNN